MIALNLLSPNQKEALRTRIIYAMIERLMIAFVASMLLSSIILLFIKIELIQVLSQVQTRQILSSEYVTVNNDIRLLTQQITRIESLQRMAFSPSSLILEIGSRTPSGVGLTGLDMDIKTKSMRINGISVDRENLLKFEESLRSMDFVTSLESPISNLFQKSDINFQFTIILDAEALKKAYEPKL